MALISVDRSKYARGKRGLHNQDTVAVALDGLTLDQVYAVGGAFLPGTDEAELRERYKLNNVGQQRMHVGNRMRKAVKAEDFNHQHLTEMCDEYRAANDAEEQEAKDAKAAEVQEKADAKAAEKAEREQKAADAKAEREAKAKEKADAKATAKVKPEAAPAPAPAKAAATKPAATTPSKAAIKRG